MRHVLPIKSTYVSDWGIWQCLRELIQNAKDEEDEHGHIMNVHHKGDWLHIENEGADLSLNALLLGETSKAGKRELRGQHGEGLDLALLAGVRDGHEIEVYTRTEKWVPKLEYLSEYNGARCLTVSTRKLKEQRSGVRVSVKIPAEMWEEHKRRFLFLAPPIDVVETDAGSLIMDEDRRGQIFVKGIYVMRAHKAYGHGFDLHNVKLDRDRQMIGAFDLHWELARIIGVALGRDPKKYVAKIMNLLSEGSDEVEYLDSHIERGSEASVALAAQFKAEHGIDAIPVRSIAESKQLEHLGAKGVVVNDATAKVLMREIGDYTSVAHKLRREAKRRLGWHDLEAIEKANITRAEQALAKVFSEHFRVAAQLQIVEFKDETVYGTRDLGSGMIQLARSQCGNYFDLMETLVHEVAHAITLAGDGQVSHVRAIEKIWRQLYEDACAVN